MLNRREFVQEATAVALAAAAEAQRPVAAGSESKSKSAVGDWPTYRHDRALTATSPLTGGLARAPRPFWSVDLGGPRYPAERIAIYDVNGDGRDEFLAIGEETITCRDSRGHLLWTLTGHPNAQIVDVRDYAGDGSAGILLTTAVAGRQDTWMVAGRTGKAVRLWRDENSFGGHIRFGKLLPGVWGAQLAATYSGQTPPAPWGGAVRLVSFAKGADKPHFHINQTLPGRFYSPIMLFADVDADGRAEMVVISHEQIWTFDTETGRQKSYADWGPQIRTYYATVAAVRLNPDDRMPSLVMINPHIPGMRAVRQDGKGMATTLWKVVVGGKEDQYHPAIKIGPGAPDIACDLDHDGKYEVIASITNEHGDGKQYLAVFDALSGKRLFETPGARILSVEDLNGDGTQEILLQEGERLQIARWTGNGFQTLWSGDRVAPLYLPTPSEGDLTRTQGVNPMIRREAAGSPWFLLQFPDGPHSCQLNASGLEIGPLVSIPAPPVKSETMQWDGNALTVRAGGKEVYRYVPPVRQTYLAPPPLVADLQAGRQVLARNAAGALLRISPDGKKSAVLLDRVYEDYQVHVDHTGAGPTVGDVDDDGENEIVAILTGTDGAPFCAIMNGAGGVKRRIELLPGTRVMNRGPIGRLGPGRGCWIVLRMFYGEGSYQGRYPVVAAFDCKTGRQLWVRDHYGTYGANPVIFAAHLPTAVHDVDGDGADEWMVCSENFYGTINVRDNRELAAPVVLSDEVPGHWTAYSYPCIGDIRGDGTLAAFHNSSFSLALVTDLTGKPIWHYGITRDTAGAWGILADVDGDGRCEIIHVQPDGVLRCFDPSPADHKCPTCPEDAALSEVNHAGKPRWSRDMGRPINRIAAADLDGDGRKELLFGCQDGKLYALAERSHKPVVLWSVPFGRRVGEPIFADVDQDGCTEILVPVEDGHLYCLKGQPTSARR